MLHESQVNFHLRQAQEILIKGEVISEELTIQILRERLASKEVAHYGKFEYTLSAKRPHFQNV